jgi:hypothetical protein
MGRRDGENPAPAVIGTAKESGIRTRAYPETLSGQLTVRLQVFGYLAFTAGRYPQSTVEITGLTAPTFCEGCCHTVTRNPVEPLQGAAASRSTGTGNSAPDSRCRTRRWAEARVPHGPQTKSGAAYGIASAHFMCPSKPSDVAIAR